MVKYRRIKIPGQIYFFTVTIKNRKDNLLIRHIKLLKFAMEKTKKILPYKTLGYVILPDHLHLLWKLPEDDMNYSERLKRIKFYFTQDVITFEKFQKNNRNEYNVWQNRFWEHAIRDESDFENHLNYIHYNPVKHGLVKQAIDWEFSSFHYYVQKGMFPRDWGGVSIDNMMDDFGE